MILFNTPEGHKQRFFTIADVLVAEDDPQRSIRNIAEAMERLIEKLHEDHVLNNFDVKVIVNAQYPIHEPER